MSSTDTPQEIHFKYKLQSNIFILDLEYLNDELTIHLIDMESSHKYSKKFTRNDCNRKIIHPQEDILQIFCNIVSRQYLEKMNQGTIYLETDFLGESYHLGNYVDRGGRGFTIFPQGVIETKRIGPQKSLACLQPDVFISKLVLQKESEIDHNSILDIKLGEIKREFFNEIKSMKMEINRLKYGANYKKQHHMGYCDENQQMIACEGSDLYSVAMEKIGNLEKELSLFKKSNPLQIDFRSPFVSKFAFDGKKIFYRGQNKNFTQILRIIPISRHDVSSFKVRIQLTQEKYVMIGIVDRIQQFNVRCSYNSGNAVAYYGNNGYRYPNGGGDGPGLKTGDVVQVIVNPSEGSVTWKINYDQYTSKYVVGKDLLSHKDRQFVPYVELYSTNDCIKWIDQDQ